MREKQVGFRFQKINGVFGVSIVRIPQNSLRTKSTAAHTRHDTMPPPTTKKKVDEELRALRIPRNRASVSQFACPLCKPGDSLGGGKNGGMFVIVGVPENDRPVAWDNLPVKLNREGVEPENFPVKFRVGVRRRVIRRHVQTFHASQPGTAEYKALATAWVPSLQYNYAGGAASARKKLKASARRKSAPAEPSSSGSAREQEQEQVFIRLPPSRGQLVGAAAAARGGGSASGAAGAGSRVSSQSASSFPGHRPRRYALTCLQASMSEAGWLVLVDVGSG